MLYSPLLQHQTLVFKSVPKSPIRFPQFSPRHVCNLKFSGKIHWPSSRFLLRPCSCSKSDSVNLTEEDFDMELGRLLRLLPEEMRRKVHEHPELHQLIEVVMDLGRQPVARFPFGDFVLSDHLITIDDLEHATSLISESNAMQVFKHLKMENAVQFTNNISEADALLALLSKIKKNARIQAAARSQGIPIYVTKTNSVMQLTKAIEALMTDYDDGFEDYDDEAKINASEKTDALEEARIAIEQIVIPKGEPVELLPRPSNILLLQKDLIRKYKLQAERVGVDPDVRLRILPFQTTLDEVHKGTSKINDDADADEFDELFDPNAETNGTPYPLNRLPLLPD